MFLHTTTEDASLYSQWYIGFVKKKRCFRWGLNGIGFDHEDDFGGLDIHFCLDFKKVQVTLQWA
ncbi:unnamed protein product [Brassica rapa subsp. trilocularis]